MIYNSHGRPNAMNRILHASLKERLVAIHCFMFDRLFFRISSLILIIVFFGNLNFFCR